MPGSIKKNFLYNILLNVSKVLFPLITAPYVSRVLEPDGVGLFNFATTYAGYFALLAALGVPMYGVREVAKLGECIEKQNKLVSEIISLEIFTTLLSSLIFCLSVLLIPQFSNYYAIFLVAGIAIYLTPFKIEWFFSGREEFGYITLRSLLIKVASVISLFIFVHKKEDLLIYVIIGTCAITLNELWNYCKLLKMGLRPYFTLHIKRHIRPLLILFASVIAISVYTMLDTLMLGFLSDYSQVGYYNSATHISKALMPIVTSLAIVAMPRLSYYMQQNKWVEINKLIVKSLSIVSFLAFPITIGVIVLAPTFVPLFFGEKFIGAVLPLQIIVLVVSIIGLNNIPVIQILAGLGHDKLYLYSVLVGTLSNFSLNLYLIPLYGAVGAAFASVMAEVLILIVSMIFVYKKTKIRLTNYGEIIKSLFVSLLFFPLGYILSLSFEGWGFVFLFTFIASVYYILLQYILKNTSVSIFLQIVNNKINHES